MRKISRIFFLLIAFAGIYFFACTNPRPAPEKAIAQVLLQQVDSFAACCLKMQQALSGHAIQEKQLQDLFLQARSLYKKFEWAAEYFEPSTSRYVNGPPVEEAEPSGPVLAPAGLQVMEGFLFPAYDTANTTALRRQLVLLLAATEKYKKHFGYIDMFNWQVFDAARLELFRVQTTGITGFDNPLTLQSMQESAAALKSMQQVLSFYEGNSSAALNPLFAAAIAYLDAHPQFNSFNRMAFITGYCNPLTKAMCRLQDKLHISMIRYNRLLNQDAQTLFDSGAFNMNAFAPDISSFATPQKIALGRLLFADPRLSGSGTRSCQSCHEPSKAFTDGLAKNTILGSHQLLGRNTPTLINAALQSAQFYDMRVNTLEDQSLNVVQSAVEMHGSLRLSVQKLWDDTLYRRLFSQAFPIKQRTGIDTLELMNAIGSYVRSLVMLNSRFDAYMRGDASALNTEEINGFNLFMGKAKCATCHYMPLFNGTFPPRYTHTEAEVIGVPASLNGHEPDADPGRFGVLQRASLLHAFKTPTVRNIALTAPYMHNGVFSSLQQVVDFYDRGGGRGMGMAMENQTLPFDKLSLAEKEKAAIIAFMKSLNSR